jgi:hypothetical protein
MKKVKYTLEDLKVTSFVSDTDKVRAGYLENSRTIEENSPLCGPTFWKGCEENY